MLNRAAPRRPHRRGRTRVWAAAGLLALLLASCDDPVAALIGVTAVSSTTSNGPAHTHRCSIPSSDLQNPPGDDNVYVTTTTDGHSHQVHVTRENLQILNEPNGFLSVQSEPAGNPSHTHRFDFNH